MYNSQACGRVPLTRYIILTLLSLLVLSACTKTTGPKVEKETASYANEKPRVKAKRSRSPSKIAKSEDSPTTRYAETPCNMADTGFGSYYPWVKNLKLGRMLMPKKGSLTADSGFDLIIHFHGGNAVRKMITDTKRGIFVVGIDLGAGSGAYGRPFSDPNLFISLLDEIEHSVAEYTDKPSAHIRRLGLTGWSAGYGAIRAILRQRAGKDVDAVVLLDGLHSNYDEKNPSGLKVDQLSPFVSFAERAANGSKYMFVSHSSIIPPGYASTTETAHYLTDQLGVRVQNSSAKDSPYLSRYEQAKSGGFLMRGYLGEGKDDHCAQIALIAEAVAALEKRWQTPKAEGRRYAPPKPVSEQTAQAPMVDAEHAKQCSEQPQVVIAAQGRSS